MRRHNLENDTLNESELQRVYNYLLYPRGENIYSKEGFVNIDNGSQGGIHWFFL